MQYVRVGPSIGWDGSGSEYPTAWPELFDLSFPISSKWKTAKRRMLFITEWVPEEDIKSGRYLSSSARDFVLRTVALAVKTAVAFRQTDPDLCKRSFDPKSWEFGYLNFNTSRWLNQPVQMRERLEKAAAQRCLALISKLKPDAVVVGGDRAAELLTEFGSGSVYRRGMLTTVTGTDIPATATLDLVSLDPSPSKKDKKSLLGPNLAGYAAERIVTALLGCHPLDVSDVKPNPKLVDTERGFEELMAKARKSRAVALDIETTSLDTCDAVPLTVQMAFDQDTGWVLPVLHPDSPWTRRQRERIRSELRGWFGQRRPHTGPQVYRNYIVGQNIGYDMRILQHWLAVRYWYPPLWDLMMGEYLLDENAVNVKLPALPFERDDNGGGRRHGVFGLQFISTRYNSDWFLEAAFSKQHRTQIVDERLECGSPALDYMAGDVQFPFAIHRKQIRRASLPVMGEDYKRDYVRLMLNLMSGTSRTTSTMRHRGTRVDVDYLLGTTTENGEFHRQRESLLAAFQSLPEVQEANTRVKTRNAVSSMFGDDEFALDMSKPAHRKTLFVDVLGLEPIAYGKSGNPSFDKNFVAHYRDESPALAKLDEYAEVMQLKRMFLDPMHEYMASVADNRADHRLHPDFGMVSTVTGRSNCRKPSLQQIPERKKTAKIVKRALTTPPGSLHYESDYSAHEVHCMAMQADDDALGEAIRSVHDAVLRWRMEQTPEAGEFMKLNGDLHRTNYASFTTTPVEDVDDDMRFGSKGITFGTVYGIGLKSLAARIKKSLDATRKILKAFFTRFWKTDRYLQDQHGKGERLYRTWSPIGRRRRLFGFMSSVEAVRAALKRRAQNSDTQGLASDICYAAADVFSRTLYEVLDEFGEFRDDVRTAANGTERVAGLPQPRVDASAADYLPVGPNAIVHDSIKGEAEFRLYFLHLHILEWSMTTGVADWFRKAFGWEITMPLDIEMSIGPDWSRKREWDWSDKHRDECVLAALEGHAEIHGLDLDPEAELRKMKGSYRVQRALLGLDERFPLPRPLI